MEIFLGIYEPNITEGLRIALPKKIRTIFKNSQTCIFTKGFEECILGYKKDIWIKNNQDIFTSKESSKKNRMLKRYTYAFASEIKLDAQGRTAIPKNLAEYAGIKEKEKVIVIGAGDHFEIWNINKWKIINKQIKQYEGDE